MRPRALMIWLNSAVKYTTVDAPQPAAGLAAALGATGSRLGTKSFLLPQSSGAKLTALRRAPLKWLLMAPAAAFD